MAYLERYGAAQKQYERDKIATMMCGFCCGNTPFDPTAERQHVQCEWCGGQITLTPHPCGYHAVNLVSKGPPRWRLPERLRDA
jgi:hypothetical protein